MSRAIEILQDAQKRALSLRPKVGGFPVLAAVLHHAGVRKNIWSLPSCQSIYITKEGLVVQQGAPLITGTHDVPIFNKAALTVAIRADQAGESSFPEFLLSTWKAGVVRYEVDFLSRKVSYFGCNNEEYVEDYPLAQID